MAASVATMDVMTLSLNVDLLSVRDQLSCIVYISRMTLVRAHMIDNDKRPQHCDTQWRRQDFVSGGAQFWRREKTENNECMSYHPRQHCILLSMRYCIRPVCHSHTIFKMKIHGSLKNNR